MTPTAPAAPAPALWFAYAQFPRPVRWSAVALVLARLAGVDTTDVQAEEPDHETREDTDWAVSTPLPRAWAARLCRDGYLDARLPGGGSLNAEYEHTDHEGEHGGPWA